MTEIDLLRTAEVIIAQQGRTGAVDYAHERYKLLLQRSESDEAALWSRIETVLRDLLEVASETRH
jgi:hypothetical protein